MDPPYHKKRVRPTKKTGQFLCPEQFSCFREPQFNGPGTRHDSRHGSEELDGIESGKQGQDIRIPRLGLRLMRSISMTRAFSPISETACSGVACGWLH